jgi:hypothetical protein
MNHHAYIQRFLYRTGILVPQFFTCVAPDAVYEAGKKSEIGFFS